MPFPRWFPARATRPRPSGAARSAPRPAAAPTTPASAHAAASADDAPRTDPRPDPRPDPQQANAGAVDRRELLSLAFLRRPRADDAATAPAPERPAPARLGIRPPGAVEEGAFVERCDACGVCLESCPFGALVRLADGRPGLHPAGDPCLLCLDVPCSHACPTGALRPVTDPRRVRIALAEVDPDRCLAFGPPDDPATPACQACFDACPLPHQALRWFGAPGRPDVSPSLCTGCGVCVRACPTGAITLHPR